MIISLGDISEKLSRYSPLEYPCRSTTISFSNIQFFEKGENQFHSDVLYICYASELYESHANGTAINLICIKDKEIPGSYTNSENFRIIAVCQDAPPTRIYNVVNSFLISLSNISQESEILVKLFNAGKDIKAIIDSAQPMLGNPIAVIDNHFQLIANSGKPIINDPSWDFLITNGYSCGKTIARYARDNVYLRAKELKTSFIIKKGFFSYDEIYAPLVIDGKIAGAVSIPASDRPFSEKDLELATFLANIISLQIQMQRNSYNLQSRESIYERIITDILSGKLTDAASINERLSNFGLRRRKSMLVFSVNTSEFDNSKLTIEHLKNALNEIFPNDITVVFNYSILALLTDKTPLLTEVEHNQLIEFLRNYDLYGGMSCPFGDISKIETQYRQAEAAAKMAKLFHCEERFNHFDEVLPYRVIDLAAKSETLDDLLEPSIKKLVSYDKQHNTEFSYSLSCYLRFDKSIQSTASFLHVHRNTFLYRIKKIQEIIGHDLNNSDYSFRLMLSYKIMEYMHGHEQ